MRLFIRFLSLLGICGCIYWIYTDRNNPEPVITLIGLIIIFCGTFIELKKAEIFMTPTMVGKFPYLFIQNSGEADAKGFNVVFPPNFPAHQREIEDIPKILRGGQIHKILVPLSFGSGGSFDIRWSWRGCIGLRTRRRQTIRLT